MYTKRLPLTGENNSNQNKSKTSFGDTIQNESFGALSRSIFYSNMLMDKVIEEDNTKLEDFVRTHCARSDLVVPERGCAVLHVLAGMDNEDFSVLVVQALLKYQRVADVNVLSEEGLAPIHVAAMWGRSRVLQVLLTNGGDPYLLDLMYRLTPSEHAVKACQWKAYNVLLTYTVILEDPSKFEKYLDSKKETPRALDETENTESRSDWRSFEATDSRNMEGLNEHAINMIMSQRRKTKVYESAVEDEMDADDSITSIESRTRSTSRFFKRKFSKINTKLNKINNRKISDYNNKYLSKETLSNKSIRLEDCDERSFSSNSQLDVHSCTIPVNKDKKFQSYSATNLQCRGKRRQENEMYFCGITESTFKSKSREVNTNKSSRSSKSSESVISGFESMKAANSRALCKMSRIFLFMLKKNHVYEKVK